MKLQSISPHDQSIVGEIEVSTKEEVIDAVESAKKAFTQWSRTSIQERVEYIKKYRTKLDEHKEEIANLITLEMGKPITQALEDIPWEFGYIDDYIQNGEGYLADETIIKNETEDYKILHEPYGVVACIAPWNFPVGMFDSGVLPALIAGNTVVFKPSEYTTLSQKKCFDLLQETGLPEGVLNIVIGDGTVGSLLVDAPVDLVWFTGSTKVGQEIYKKCGEKFIKAICELGGSSAGIIFDDADLEATLESLYWARFLNCGQVCSAIKRLFVQRSVYDSVLEKFVERLSKVKVGNPLEKDTGVGPLVSTKQLSRLEDQMKDALEKGATIEAGGKRPDSEFLKNGNYYQPTLLTNVNFEMKVLHEEVFGPILPITPFDTEEEVIKLANYTEYGLTSEIYTKDIERGVQMAKELQSGVVAINTDNFYKPICPIGGYKKSGIGREYGKIGMQEFTQVKLLAVQKG
jgi:succinate-semialdehyde dehydrogenase / glutarate-semialdehyde dehydrogenase